MSEHMTDLMPEWMSAFVHVIIFVKSCRSFFFVCFFAWIAQSNLRSTSQSDALLLLVAIATYRQGRRMGLVPGKELRNSSKFVHLLSLLSFLKDEPALPSAEDVSNTDLVIGVITHRLRHFQIFSACIMVWQGLLQQRYLWVKAVVLQFDAIGKPGFEQSNNTIMFFSTPKLGNVWQLNYTEFKGTHELDWFLPFSRVLEGWQACD